MPIKREGKLNGIEAKLENAVKRGLIEAGKTIAQRAQAKAPRDTGRLKRSLTISPDGPQKVGPASWKIEVGPFGGNPGESAELALYATVQEFGSGLHATRGPKRRIVPKEKNVLAFKKWRDAPFPPGPGGFYVFKSVAGVRPHPYLIPAFNESKDRATALIAESIRAAFQ